MIGIILGIVALVLIIYHWELIDKAFVKFMESLG